TNSIMFTPAAPSAGPTGGAGVAWPAWIWSLMMLAIFFLGAIALPNCVVVRAELIERSSHSGSPTAGAAEGPGRRYLPDAAESIGIGSDLRPTPMTRGATGTLQILATWSKPSSTGVSRPKMDTSTWSFWASLWISEMVAGMVSKG